MKDKKRFKLLLSLVFNTRLNRMVGALPYLPPITRPVQIDDPPNVVRVQPFCHNNSIYNEVNIDWYVKATHKFSSSTNISIKNFNHQFIAGDASLFNSQVK